MVLNKQHFRVMMKVWLNNGFRKNSQFISDSEQNEFDCLVSEGYIDIMEEDYSCISPNCGFRTVMENILSNMEIMNAPHKKQEEPAVSERLANIHLIDTNITRRSALALKRAGISTLSDVVTLDRKEIEKLRGCGPKVLYELEDVLSYYNLSFGMKK